ncbi:MAG: hypothetical protein LUH14_09760 [Clostridiaceae bacterium]|nr:hypothetical protein [Clostridiaceae bacterium]
METEKRQLHFHFHNPNPVGIMEKRMEKILVEYGIGKLQDAICEEGNRKVQRKADQE